MKLIGRSLASALLLTVASARAVFADAATDAMKPVTSTLNTIVEVAIGIGVAICIVMLVYGGIEKMLAGSNIQAETQARRRIANAIVGLVVICSASTIAAVIVAVLKMNGVIPQGLGI
jgi:Type IV secretion system pilin